MNAATLTSLSASLIACILASVALLKDGGSSIEAREIILLNDQGERVVAMSTDDFGQGVLRFHDGLGNETIRMGAGPGGGAPELMLKYGSAWPGVSSDAIAVSIVADEGGGLVQTFSSQDGASAFMGPAGEGSVPVFSLVAPQGAAVGSFGFDSRSAGRILLADDEGTFLAIGEDSAGQVRISVRDAAGEFVEMQAPMATEDGS